MASAHATHMLQPDSTELLQLYRVEDTVEHICNRGYKVVTLQFPDELLPHAGRVAVAVQAGCRARGHEPQTYILADTTYNSLSVDEVAAAHVSADCVIHYGRASLTKLSRIPAFFVFPEAPLDVPAAAASLAACSTVTAATGPVLLFVDQPLLHLQQDLVAAVQQAAPGVHWVCAQVPTRHLEPEQRPAPAGCCHGRQLCSAGQSAQPSEQVCCSGGSCLPAEEQQHKQEQAQQNSNSSERRAANRLDPAASQAGTETAYSHSSSRGSSTSDRCSNSVNGIAGYTWELPSGADAFHCSFVWVGSAEAPALTQLQLTHNSQPWAVYDPAAGGSCGALTEGLPLEISRTLRRRYYLVERARDANIVGILVGTLGVAGYRDAIDRLRSAARAAGKKTYTLLVGKPSPAKLANFPEVEVFVMVADPQGQVLDSKEYLAPIITPHEAMLAFSPDSQWEDSAYRLDFEGVIQGKTIGADARSSTSRQPRFSLLDGSYHGDPEEDEDEAAAVAAAVEPAEPGTALALQAQAALQITPAPNGRSDLVEAKSAADYLLHKRTWTGVEAPLVGSEARPVEKAVPGLSGRAAGFAGEGGSSRG